MKEGYGDAEICGQSMAARLQPQIERCVREVLERIAANTTTFCFCDFGSADGNSSSTVAKTVALQLLKSSGGAPRQISVVLEDQEWNDFRPSFPRVTKALNEVNIVNFVASIGRTFFAQCLPEGSLHFGTSNFALHFLDLTTPPRAGFKLGYTFELLRRLRQVDGNLSALSDDDQAQVEANKEKGALDWQQFLLCRAKELCVGGRLLVASLGSISPSSEEYAQNSSVFRNEQEEMEFIVNAVYGMIADGEIGEDEADEFIFCAHYPTLEEVKAPFHSADSPVRKAGLQLVRAEIFLNLYPDVIENVESLSEDDVKRLAAVDCRAIQSYFWPLVERGFSAKAGRSKKEAIRLTEMAFERVEKEMIEKRWFNIGNVMFLAEVEKE